MHEVNAQIHKLRWRSSVWSLEVKHESKMAPALLTSINRWYRRRQVTWRFLLTFLVHVWTPRGVEKKRCSTQDLTSSFNWKRVEVNYCSCRRWGVWNDKDGEEVVHGVLILCWHADNDGRGRWVRQLHIKGYLVIQSSSLNRKLEMFPSASVIESGDTDEEHRPDNFVHASMCWCFGQIGMMS